MSSFEWFTHLCALTGQGRPRLFTVLHRQSKRLVQQARRGGRRRSKTQRTRFGENKTDVGHHPFFKIILLLLLSPHLLKFPLLLHLPLLLFMQHPKFMQPHFKLMTRVKILTLLQLQYILLQLLHILLSLPNLLRVGYSSWSWNCL